MGYLADQVENKSLPEPQITNAISVLINSKINDPSCVKTV